MEASLNKLNEELRLEVRRLLSEIDIVRRDSLRIRLKHGKELGRNTVGILKEAETQTFILEWDDKTFDRISLAIGLWQMVWKDCFICGEILYTPAVEDAYIRVRRLMFQA